MIKNTDVLAERLKGIKVGDKDLTIDMLKDALSKEDQIELTAGNVHILDETALDGLKETMKKQGYSEGKTAGSEMTIKELKVKAGLEYDGKDPDKFIQTITEKISKEKGIEPNKKITELTESLENLRKVAESKDGEVKTWEQKYSGLEKTYRVNDVIASKLPKNLQVVNAKQFTTLLQAEGYTVDFTEGGEPIQMLHGKALKDKMEKPIPVETVLTDFATRNNWLNGGGRGAGDEGGKGGANDFKTMTDVYAYMDKNNINPMSPDGKRLQDEFEAKKQA